MYDIQEFGEEEDTVDCKNVESFMEEVGIDIGRKLYGGGRN